MATTTIGITEIEQAIHFGGAGTPPPGVTVSPQPDPYIAPEFQILEGSLSSEVIIIKAQAAVGKTVTAEYLSSRRQARLLDTAHTRVAAFALRGAVQLDAFHRGECPIIVDALDEGALLVGERSRDAFLFTSRDVVLESRAIKDKAKVIFLGRPESADWAKEVMLENPTQQEPVSICVLEVSFFNETPAKNLVRLYAKKEIDRQLERQVIRPSDADALHKQIDSPTMSDLVNAYFLLLAKALGLQSGELWTAPVGRSFVGYAPILAAIGELLAMTPNPYSMLEDLGEDASSAWNVIDIVIQKILAREQQEKILPQVKREASGNIPSDAYDAQEQFEYLTQAMEGRQYQIDLLQGIKTRFDDKNDLEKYREVVHRQLPQHPFLKEGKATNDVLSSKILAGAICAGLDTLYAAAKGTSDSALLSLLERASRQPFLWRFIQSELEGIKASAPLLHGIYVGYIVNSYLNDAAYGQTQGLGLWESKDAGVGVRLDHVTFSVLPPVRLFGRVAGCEMKCESTVLQIMGMGSSKFTFEGNNHIIAQTLHFGCEAIGVDAPGELWLEPRRPGSYWPPNFSIAAQVESRLGWGDNLADHYPWKEQDATLPNPWRVPIAVQIVERLRGKDIVVLENYDPPDDDQYLRSIAQEYGSDWHYILKALVEGFVGVSRTPIDSAGSKRKYRIVGVQWERLRAACSDPGRARGEYREFMEKVHHLL